MSRYLAQRYASLQAYVPGEQPREKGLIKLNTNESPYPPAPEVCRAIDAAEVADLRLYSDPTSSALKEKLANHYGVKKENIFLSNGSDELLNFAFQAFGERGVCFADITYGFYQVYCQLHGWQGQKIPLREGFQLDYRDYCGLGKMVVIANPNAPTGLSIPSWQVEKILKSNEGSLVLIDEAYVDFGGESCLSLLDRYENLLISRTFSKSRCLAGGRLGYAFGSPEVIADLEKLKFSTNPYNLDRLTLRLGEKTVEAEDYYRDVWNKIMKTRDWTAGQLENLGFQVLPSQTNFLFIRREGLDGKAFYQQLRSRRILVRHFEDSRIRQFNRVTIGTQAQMEAFLEATRQILGGTV